MGCFPREFRERSNARERALFMTYIAAKAEMKKGEQQAAERQQTEAEQAQQQMPNEAPTQSAHQQRPPPGPT